MNNSLGQDPCVVASYLESVCWGGGTQFSFLVCLSLGMTSSGTDFTVSALPPDTHYAAPTVAEANSCECSTVTYSLISACVDCQNATFLT